MALKRKKLDLREACSLLIKDIEQCSEPSEHIQWRYELSSFDEKDFFYGIQGTWRISFKSRDRDLTLFGLGAADFIHNDALSLAVERAQTLSDDQIYFGAMRFDEAGAVSKEWEPFGKKIFILPMLLVIIKNDHISLSLNYRRDGHLSWRTFVDHAMSMLATISREKDHNRSSIEITLGPTLPSREKYRANIRSALYALNSSHQRKKVVMGRRRSLTLSTAIDPVELFFRLKANANNAFLFFLDDGKGRAFFGNSPELLYRRHHSEFETESLAGTRPRSLVESDDVKLREALFNSLKDHREHALVSFYVEEKLKEFGATNLVASDLEIIAVSYVQHLVKRYRGTISAKMSDETVVTALHPTPAVCGLCRDWSLDFIRCHEGFDRGFYAGPIGFLSKDNTEFAVGLRSALVCGQEIFVYAASGIVAGSTPEEEEVELDNKEKTILSIFEVEFDNANK